MAAHKNYDIGLFPSSSTYFIIKIQNQDREVAALEFKFIGKKTVKIMHAGVDISFRRQNLQHILFLEMLSRFPNIKKIKTGLSDFNAQIFRDSLFSRLKKHPLYIDTNERDLDRAFDICCSNILKKELIAMFIEAIKDTPSYKSRKKIGFSKIDPSSVRLFSFKSIVNIIYSVFRD